MEVFKFFLKKINEFSILRKLVYVFGDSHAEVFNYISEKKLIPFQKFVVTKVGGATAQGMRNPNSYTNALNIFEDKINKINKKATLIFMLGEVDTGFVIWYRAKKYNEDVSVQLNNSIEKYTAFITNLIERGYKNIIIFGAPLPTIKDNQDWGEIANLRREISVSQKERTKLTLSYNEQLKLFCIDNNIKFIDTDHFLFDAKKGVIYENFLNKNKNDHHLNNKKYSELIINLLNYKNG